MVVLYTLVIISALVGNILVCIAVYINPNLKQNVASYFIVSLAISDIGTASFSMPFDVETFTTDRRWYHGEVLCIVWTTIYLFTVPSSIWNLFIMSIDRYKTLKNPWNRFKESHSMTARRAIITIVVLWVYCLVFALLPLTGWKFKAYPKSVNDNNYCRFNIGLNFSIAGSFLNFYLPMFAMCGIYYKVYRIAHAHRKFPLALESRFHKVSANESQTASTLFPADSLSRPSIDQQQSYDGSENKQENVDTAGIGLENVSFFFDENSTDMKGPRDESKTEPGRSAACGLKKRKSENEEQQESDMTASGYFHGTLKADDQYCLKEKELSKTYNPNSKKCLGQSRKHDSQRHGSNIDGSQKCEKEKRTFNESDTKSKSNSAKAMLSPETIPTAGSERLSCIERDKSHAKQSGLNKSHNEILNLQKTIKIPKPLTSDKAGAKDSTANQERTKSGMVKSSSDYSLNKEKGHYFPLEKKLRQKSPYQSEEDVCSLKKFSKRSEDDTTLRVQDTRSKVNDSLTYSNKRRLKHLAMNTKAARTISIIVGAFLFCWVPYTTLSVGLNLCGPPCYKLPGIVMCMDVLLWMGYLNCALNPVLFSYQNIQFRKSYRQIVLFLLNCFNICKSDS